MPDKAPTFSDNADIAELRVAGGTPPKDLAASIVHLLNDDKRVKLAAIGHQAVGQAVKAIPVVNQYCIAQGYLVTILPSFHVMHVPNREGEPEVDEDRSAERTVTMLLLIKVSPQ